MDKIEFIALLSSRSSSVVDVPKHLTRSVHVGATRGEMTNGRSVPVALVARRIMHTRETRFCVSFSNRFG